MPWAGCSAPFWKGGVATEKQIEHWAFESTLRPFPSIQRGEIDLQNPCCPDLVPVSSSQYPIEITLVHLLETNGIAIEGRPGVGGRRLVQKRQLLSTHDCPSAQNDESFHGVFEFADVSGPRCLSHYLHCFITD